MRVQIYLTYLKSRNSVDNRASTSSVNSWRILGYIFFWIISIVTHYLLIATMFVVSVRISSIVSYRSLINTLFSTNKCVFLCFSKIRSTPVLSEVFRVAVYFAANEICEKNKDESKRKIETIKRTYHYLLRKRKQWGSRNIFSKPLRFHPSNHYTSDYVAYKSP